jgi:hypothetical protein
MFEEGTPSRKGSFQREGQRNITRDYDDEEAELSALLGEVIYENKNLFFFRQGSEPTK